MFFWYNQTFSLYDPGYYVESFFNNASIYITKTKLAKRTCSISNLYIACSISALKAAAKTLTCIFSVQRLAYECLSQSIDSAKHSPNLVPTATKPDTVQTESMSYAQYLNMIKSQISCAKDIHNALLECSKKIAGKGQPQGIM